MGGIPEWMGYVINPTFGIAKAVGGDTAAAVADPVLYQATAGDRQAKAKKEQEEADKRARAANAPAASPSPFTTYYKSPWET